MKAKDLRNSILQMAVQGKLVPQDPNDEPASVLLERIRTERTKLIKEKKIKAPKGGESIIYRASDGSHYEKRGKGEPVCIDDEIPFDIPESWEWARFESLASQIGDGLHGTPDFEDGAPYAFINGNNLVEGRIAVKPDTKRVSKEEYEKYRVALSDNTLLLSINGTIGNVAYYNQEQVIFGKSACYIDVFSPMKREYIHLLISTRYFLEYATNAATQTTIKNVSLRAMRQLLIPVPPMAEQKRISDIYLLLATFVAEYGALENAREHLDAELPDRLRKSILQLAVQGKLVEQDPTDEPASALLERIRAERAKLVKAKKIKAPKGGESVICRVSDGGYYEKRGKGEPVCIDDEIPFDIPESWEWARLESVTTYIQRGKSPKYSSVKKYPVVAQKCNQWSGFSLELAKFIDPATVGSYAEERILQDGDLLWNSTGLGTLGRMAVYDSSVNEYGWAVADSHVTVIRTLPDWLDYRYAFAYFAGPSVQSVIEDQASGSTKQKELAQDTVRSYLIPVPPREEQARIAEKLEKVLPRFTNR